MRVKNSIPNFQNRNWRPVFPGMTGNGNSRSPLLPRTPWYSGFFDRKRLKEGERVVQGHIHERVGESPRRYENFDASASLKRFLTPSVLKWNKTKWHFLSPLGLFCEAFFRCWVSPGEGMKRGTVESVRWKFFIWPKWFLSNFKSRGGRDHLSQVIYRGHFAWATAGYFHPPIFIVMFSLCEN